MQLYINSGKGKTIELKKDQGLPEFRREEGMDTQNTQDFQGSENTLVILQLWTHVRLSKPVDCATPTAKLNVNCRIWVIIICQCRIFNYNKFTL